MLNFISKDLAFKCLDDGIHRRLGWATNSIHLKTWQDMVVYRMLRDSEGLRIAEIGGGASRILPQLAGRNTCLSVGRPDGAQGSPAAEAGIEGVTPIKADLGDFDPALEPESLDAVCSAGVIHRVPDDDCFLFIEDMLRVLKPGGLAVHAIDMYVENRPMPTATRRLELYAGWLERGDVVPLGARNANRAAFDTWMVSNPDLTMWNWNRSSPAMAEMRKRAQSVSLILAFRKKA